MKGGVELAHPRPAFVQSQDESPTAPDDEGGDVQEPMAHGLGLGLCQGAVKAALRISSGCDGGEQVPPGLAGVKPVKQ